MQASHYTCGAYECETLKTGFVKSLLPARCCACCAESMSFALVEDPGNDIVEVVLNQRGSEMKSSLGLCRIIMNFGIVAV